MLFVIGKNGVRINIEHLNNYYIEKTGYAEDDSDYSIIGATYLQYPQYYHGCIRHVIFIGSESECKRRLEELDEKVGVVSLCQQHNS